MRILADVVDAFKKSPFIVICTGLMLGYLLVFVPAIIIDLGRGDWLRAAGSFAGCLFTIATAWFYYRFTIFLDAKIVAFFDKRRKMES